MCAKTTLVFLSLLALSFCKEEQDLNAYNNTTYVFDVYVLCDEPMTKTLRGRDKPEYFGAYFNAVNLIFRRVPEIKIRFRVVNIETAEHLEIVKKAYQAIGKYNEKYMYRLWPEHLNLTSNGQLSDKPTTAQLSTYFKKVGEPYSNSHIIVLFSGRTLLISRVQHDRKNLINGKPLAVQSFPKREGICNDQNIVITQDNGFFFDITYTARALARLLGANYDYAKKEKCLYSSSMLMGDIKKKESPVMSPCTVKDLKDSLTTHSKKQCLNKKYKSHVKATSKLPADIIKPDEYCAHNFPGQYNIAECTEEKWSLSGYEAAGMCKLRCCYGRVDPYLRSQFQMWSITALYGYPCTHGDIKDGVCAKEVCGKNPTYAKDVLA